MKFCKASLFLALLVAVCVPAVAQAQIHGNVPFNFFAAGKSLPAGHYQVERLFDGNLAAWRLVNENGQATIVLTNSVQSLKTEDPPSLVFPRRRVFPGANLDYSTFRPGLAAAREGEDHAYRRN